MNNKKIIFIACVSFASILFLASIIGAILKLINAPAIILAILFISGIILQKGLPWWKSFLISNLKLQPQQRNGYFKPRNKQEAATTSLKSIEKLISLITNKVESQALMQEQIRVSRELKRRNLVLVVFGIGSSGKTSLIRALLNEIVGEVSPAMGSTLSTKSYKLRLKGLKRGIDIIDTPGILEAGVQGRIRENKAIVKASNADLMIVVIDSDLRAAELEIIKNLVEYGKRLFLVLNKIDLRGEAEVTKLLETIKYRCSGFIKSEDIISSSASPQTITIRGGKHFQPKPEINRLIKKLSRVLYEEGEELIADNIILQCGNLGREGKRVLNKQRKYAAQRIIDRFGWISSGVIILTPVPLIDLLGAAAVNAQMVIEIAKVYGVDLTRERAQELALSVGKCFATLGLVKGGLSIITTSLSLNIPTYLVGKVVQGVTAAWLTRIGGLSFITYFQQNQNWGDGGMQEVVQNHYDVNKREENLKNFIQKALKRVIEPLSKNKFKELPPNQKLQREGGAWPHENP